MISLTECRREAQNCRDRREVEVLLSELTQECGFSLDDSAGAGEQVRFRHDAYQIEATLPPQREHWGKKLRQLQEQFLSHEMKWEQLLDEARSSGWTLAREDSGTTLTKGAHTMELSAGRFISLGKLDDVVSLINGPSEVACRLNEEVLAARKERMRRAQDKLSYEVLPQHGEELLVLDASVFMRLVAPRGEKGARWLDLLTTVSKLPNVRLIVPAAVADFELLGELSPFDEKQSLLIEARRSAVTEPLRSFFAPACRIRVGDGEVQSKGIFSSTARILIVETPEDRRLYADILAIKKDTKDNPREFERRLREEIFGHGRGESSIRSFIEDTSFKNHITVVTDDIRFSKGLPRNTTGRPISTCTTGHLLNELFDVREYIPDFDWGNLGHCYEAQREIEKGTFAMGGAAQYIFDLQRLGDPSQGSPTVYSVQSIIRRALFVM